MANALRMILNIAFHLMFLQCTFYYLQAVHDAEAVLELAKKKAENAKEKLAQVNFFICFVKNVVYPF